MKKYLMMALAVVAFASCSKSDDVSDPNRNENSDKYTAAFTEAFGSINSQVNWGFNPMVVNNTIDKSAATRSHFADKNRYADIFDNIQPDPTENGDEITVVSEWFATHESPESYRVNWSDFFVWQVSSTDAGKSHMDQLWCGATKQSMEHVNNFNSGDCADGSWVGHAMVMLNSGTLEWAYQESLNNVEHTILDHFVCIPGYVIAPDNPNVCNYYYVGLDYDAAGTDPNQHVDRDYLYNDWIVRIVPGEFKNTQRIMVEDLIATNLTQVDKSDWDFNDAVFDVAFSNDNINNENKLVAHITLYAAGGTMALTVGGKEVHELFGVNTNVMVNTDASAYGASKDGLAPVIFSVIMGDADWNGTHTADEIPVFIGAQELKAEEGKAPQKIVTSKTTRWMKEKKIITLGYADFNSYVQNNAPKDWYNNVTDANVLY